MQKKRLDSRNTLTREGRFYLGVIHNLALKFVRTKNSIKTISVDGSLKMDMDMSREKKDTETEALRIQAGKEVKIEELKIKAETEALKIQADKEAKTEALKIQADKETETLRIQAYKEISLAKINASNSLVIFFYIHKNN